LVVHSLKEAKFPAIFPVNPKGKWDVGSNATLNKYRRSTRLRPRQPGKASEYYGPQERHDLYCEAAW
jgi:hypothetical protein